MTRKVVTEEEIAYLENQLAIARSKLAQQVKANRPLALKQLAEIKSSLDSQIAEAERIASDAGLVFYYSTGYEGFYWVDKEDWSESSRHC